MATAIFKKGDKDPYIVKIQRALNEIMKSQLTADGDFGALSEKVLMGWQSMNGIPMNGIYSDKTSAVLDIYIDRRFLKEQDFVDAAAKLQCEVAAVKAIQEVESKGAGFFNSGRPVILFERHVFKKQLDAFLALNVTNVRAVAQRAGLTFSPGQDLLPTLQAHLLKTQGDIYNNVTGGYIGGEAEHGRLAKAGILDLPSAQKSASWGLFQIMGYHFSTLKFTTVTDMVRAFTESEGKQMQGVCDFILADNNLLTAIRTKNWLKLALGYNGAGQKGYDQRLAAAYAKYNHN